MVPTGRAGSFAENVRVDPKRAGRARVAISHGVAAKRLQFVQLIPDKCQLQQLLRTKFKDWEYEAEYRRIDHLNKTCEIDNLHFWPFGSDLELHTSYFSLLVPATAEFFTPAPREFSTSTLLLTSNLQSHVSRHWRQRVGYRELPVRFPPSQE